MNLKNLKNRAGFTLIELIVVIAIMAILAGVAVPVYSGYIEKAEKAADLQLLGAVNGAFAAAVVENGEADLTKVSASITLNGAEGEKTVASVSARSANIPTGADVNGSFFKYYEGNQTAQFKVITALVFDAENGVFTDALDHYSDQIGRFEGSNYYGNIGALTGAVDNMADMLADRVADDGIEDLFKNNMVEGDYEKFLETYNLSEESPYAEVANASVMYVADKLSGLTANDIKTQMNGDVNNLISEYGTIPTAAMLYGLMAGYTNSDYNTTGTTLSQPSGVTEVLTQFAEMSKTDGFNNYFSANTGTGGGMDDLDGFLAAMDVVNGYEGSFDLADDDLFISDSTNALLESLLGSTTSAK